MCQLLGLSFNLHVTPNISFRGFRHKGDFNPHGWGLAFYPDKSAQIIKEPIRAGESQLSAFLQNYSQIKSKIFIGHVRYTSVGRESHKNTHPFSRELDGKEFVFAHNGTLYNYYNLDTGRFTPIGDTDSEYIFCHLLNCIEKKGITQWSDVDYKWLHSKLEEINDYGDFNCIFSDGENLFCYHDKKDYTSLEFVMRKPPYHEIELQDEDWKVNLAAEKNPEQTGFIIATKRLTNEVWQSFAPGQLIVFKNGKIIYPTSSNFSGFKKVIFTDIEKEILKIIRNNPNRLSLKEISKKLKYSDDEIKKSIFSLLKRKYLRQDSRDKVKWNNENAIYFTEPAKRKEIDNLIL